MIISASHWTSAPGGCNWTSVTHNTKLDEPLHWTWLVLTPTAGSTPSRMWPNLRIERPDLTQSANNPVCTIQLRFTFFPLRKTTPFAVTHGFFFDVSSHTNTHTHALEIASRCRRRWTLFSDPSGTVTPSLDVEFFFCRSKSGSLQAPFPVCNHLAPHLGKLCFHWPVNTPPHARKHTLPAIALWFAHLAVTHHGECPWRANSLILRAASVTDFPWSMLSFLWHPEGTF